MSTQTITAPVILDSTGQSILTALGQIKEAVQPTNSCLDIDISLPTTGWSGEGPYTYTYSNTHITSGCAVKVNFLESASSGGVLCLDYEKVTGGVQFTSDSVPTATIPVRIHVLNADATSTTATTADAVSTDAVSGASNVQDALTTLNTQLIRWEYKAVNSQNYLWVAPEDGSVNGLDVIIAGSRGAGNEKYICVIHCDGTNVNYIPIVGTSPTASGISGNSIYVAGAYAWGYYHILTNKKSTITFG